jgi:hypothetical protein
MSMSVSTSFQGHSPTLLATLAEAEGKFAELDARIEAQRPPEIKASTEAIREYAFKSRWRSSCCPNPSASAPGQR